MHEFKQGALKAARGMRTVRNPKQAVAIALSEAGASKYESEAENRRNLHRTEAKARRGETYRDAAEGGKRRASKKARVRGNAGVSKTKAELYAAAKRHKIAGRSKMNKRQLERALHAH